MAANFIISIITLAASIYFLFDVSTTNPGILEKGTMTNEEFMTEERKVIVNDVEIILKYCETCRIVREPRSFHCNICGNCIQKHGKSF